jgi:hypothetical protein
MAFILHYNVSNNGDGSASVHFHDNSEQAEAADEAQEEGWGESSASSLELQIQDGKIVRKCTEWDGKKHKTVYKPLEEV